MVVVVGCYTTTVWHHVPSISRSVNVIDRCVETLLPDDVRNVCGIDIVYSVLSHLISKSCIIVNHSINRKSTSVVLVTCTEFRIIGNSKLVGNVLHEVGCYWLKSRGINWCCRRCWLCWRWSFNRSWLSWLFYWRYRLFRMIMIMIVFLIG